VGHALVGVVAFGSWARGRATTASDIDLLVVAERDFALTRSVYGALDDPPLTVAGRAVELHVVRLPDRDGRITGVWAEVAIDGIVLFERGMLVSTYLAEVRRGIVGGRLARRTVHGQPYWHEVA
jgi:hypothetical protein